VIVCAHVPVQSISLFFSLFPHSFFHFLFSAKQIWHEGRGPTDNEVPASFMKILCSYAEKEDQKLLPERLLAEGSVAA